MFERWLPQFTPCFQDGLAPWIPCAFLWLMLIYEVFRLKSLPRHVIPYTLLSIFKLVSLFFCSYLAYLAYRTSYQCFFSSLQAFLVFLCAINVFQIISAINNQDAFPGVNQIHYITPAIEILTFVSKLLFSFF